MKKVGIEKIQIFINKIKKKRQKDVTKVIIFSKSKTNLVKLNF